MVINQHGSLINTSSSGGGYHGRCRYCNLALVTDLGYSSWDNTTCFDREIELDSDIPEIIKSYADFHNFRWDWKSKKYLRLFSNDEYSLDEIQEKINLLNSEK